MIIFITQLWYLENVICQLVLPDCGVNYNTLNLDFKSATSREDAYISCLHSSQNPD